MSKHTAETLKYFLGLDVYLNKGFSLTPMSTGPTFNKGSYKLVGLCSIGGRASVQGDTEQEQYCDYCRKSHIKTVENYYDMVAIGDITPILKTVDQLSEEEKIGLINLMFCPGEMWSDDPVEISPDFCFHYGSEEKGNAFYKSPTTETLHEILQAQAGAIPCSDSPTGYKDFIHGLPCYKFGEAE